MTRNTVTCIATLCAIACTVPGLAQEPSARGPVAELTLEQLLNVEVDEVFGASRYHQRVIDAPASVTIVTHEEIERFGYRTLGEVLRGVRGFYISNDRNYSYLGTRGFSRPGDYNTRVLVMIDGHRLNESIYDSVYIGTEFPIHIDLIERVEVVRGPSSSLYGTNALFGVVNVVTRSAAALSAGRAAIEAGTLGTRAGSVTYGLPSPTRGDFVVGASLYASEGESAVTVPGYGVARDMDDDDAFSVFGSWRRKGWGFQAAYASRDKHIPTGAFGTALDDRRSQTEDNRGYLVLSYDGTWRGNGLSWKTSYDRYSYSGVYAYTAEVPGEMNVLSLDNASADWAQTDVMLTRRVARKHFLTGGIEYRHQFREHQRSEALDPYELLVQRDSSSRNFAAYLQDEFTVTSRLTVTAGLRQDVRSQWDDSTNLRVAGIYKPFSHSAFKLLHGSAFRAPNPYELYYYSNPLPLVPERIRTTEIVWEQYARKHLRMTVSAFVYRMNDLISQVPANTRDGFVFENHETAKASGIEFEAERSWPVLNIVGSYTFQTAKDNEDRTLSNSPRHLVRARATGPIVRRWLFFGAEGLYTGDRETLDGGVAESSFLTNLTLTWRQFGRAKLSMTVGNLFNRLYVDPGGAEHPADVISQPGRTVRARLEWRF